MINKILIIVFVVMVPLFSCSIFDAKATNGKILVGRNFDFSKGKARVSLLPPNKDNNGVVLISFEDNSMSFEGMNDRGMFVAISAVPHSKTPLNILKPIRKSLEFVKIILQKSKSIDEAIRQFDKYSIVFGEFLGNPLVHFKIVDRFGKSIVIEFVDDKIKIIKDKKAKIMTNHYLSNISIKSDNPTSLKRYNYIKNRKFDNIKSLFEGLNKVRQKNTLWSNVYDLTHQKIYIKYLDNEIAVLDLKEELFKSNKPFYYELDKLKNKKAIPINKPKSTISIRPHFGFGSSHSSHYGARLLLKSNKNQAYGLEITKFETKDDKFNAIGIVLEQKVWEWFHMSIGTIGYFDYERDSQNVFGIVSNLGWEPDNHIPFKPFVTLRSDIIFAKKTKKIFSISFGFKWSF